MPQNWEERLSSEFSWDVIFGKDSLAQKAIVDFIKQLRQQDMEKLIKMLEEFETYAYIPEFKKAIQDYYEN